MAGREEDGLGNGPLLESRLFPEVNHYYGDIARQLMLAGVLLMMAGAPFYADSLRAEFPALLIGAVLIVAFAALTNPFKRSVVVVDAILSGAAAVMYGAWAFWGYDTASGISFLLRDAIAVFFLVAFYFSLKTLRAMVMHQIGKPDSSAEFRRMKTPQHAREIIEEGAQAEEVSDPLKHEKEVVKEISHHQRGD